MIYIVGHIKTGKPTKKNIMNMSMGANPQYKTLDVYIVAHYISIEWKIMWTWNFQQFSKSNSHPSYLKSFELKIWVFILILKKRA